MAFPCCIFLLWAYENCYVGGQGPWFIHRWNGAALCLDVTTGALYAYPAWKSAMAALLALSRMERGADQSCRWVGYPDLGSLLPLRAPTHCPRATSQCLTWSCLAG